MSKIGCRMFQAVMRLGMCFIKYREPVMLTGENSTGEIGKIFKRHQISCVLLVTDKGIVSKNLHQSSLEALKKNNIKCVIYDKTVPNPTIDNIEEGLKMYLENACQGILTIGGGSAMDCAKGIGARVANPKKSISQMRGILKVTHKIPILVAVPTTAGTGSETTLAAVITDSKTHEKYAINDPKLIPHYAVLDPVLTLSLPPSLTASTGMDAFVHAIEAYIGKSNTKNTEKNAELATRLIIENLQKAFDDGKNLEAREKMHNAATIAGMAFANSFLGMVHAMAHKVGAEFHTVHGYTCAILLPHCIRYNGTVPSKLSVWPKYNVYHADKRYQTVAKLLGLKASTPEEGVKSLADAVTNLIREIGLSPSFADLGIDEKQWNDRISEIAVLAYEDQCSPATPRVPMVEDMVEILKKAYKGN